MEWLEAFNNLRIKSGMSLDELSAKSGIPKGTLSKITAGITKSPSIETMRCLVHAMGYTLDDLDKREKPPSKTDDGLIGETVELFGQLTDREQRIMIALAKSLLSNRE